MDALGLPDRGLDELRSDEGFREIEHLLNGPGSDLERVAFVDVRSKGRHTVLFVIAAAGILAASTTYLALGRTSHVAAKARLAHGLSTINRLAMDIGLGGPLGRRSQAAGTATPARTGDL